MWRHQKTSRYVGLRSTSTNGILDLNLTVSVTRHPDLCDTTLRSWHQHLLTQDVERSEKPWWGLTASRKKLCRSTGRKPNNKIQLLKSGCFTGHSGMFSILPARSVLFSKNCIQLPLPGLPLSSALTPSIVRVARNSRAATGNSLEQLKDGTLKSLGSYRLSVRQRIHRQLT